MRIGELGRAAGVDSETIRYYERAGLLLPPARALNGYRAYGVEHLERLAFIRHCRVQARLKSMRALEKQLAALRLRCEAGHLAAECGILHELVAAAHGESCVCHAEAGAGSMPQMTGSSKRHP